MTPRHIGSAVGIWIAAFTIATSATLPADEKDPAVLTFSNTDGQVQTVNVRGALEMDNPFFQDLGTNGRRCVTWHQPSSAWTITPANVQERSGATTGSGPICANSDRAKCEGAG